MKKKENYIKYFTDNVDEIELPAYICRAMFNLMKLANISEEEIYKKYEFTNNCNSEKIDRKALYKMLVDIEKIDPSILYNNYYLKYFE